MFSSWACAIYDFCRQRRVEVLCDGPLAASSPWNTFTGSFTGRLATGLFYYKRSKFRAIIAVQTTFSRKLNQFEVFFDEFMIRRPFIFAMCVDKFNHSRTTASAIVPNPVNLTNFTSVLAGMWP